jgi:hypothetical protein
MRESRDRPEPLSMMMPGLLSPRRSASHMRTTSRACSGVPVPRCVSARLRNSCCDITLLLNLLMSRITSASGGELSSKLGGSLGATPSRTRPVSRPPISRHSPVSTRAL